MSTNIQFSALAGFTLLILSQVAKGLLGEASLAFASVSLLYALGSQLAQWHTEYKAASLPPFGMSLMLNFKSMDERDIFRDRLSELVTDFRREQDATNGLTEDQLGEAGLDAEGQKLSRTESLIDAARASRRKQEAKGVARDKVAARFSEGWTVEEIMRDMGYNEKSTVYKHLKNAGIDVKAAKNA